MEIPQILHQHNLTLLKSNIFNKDHIFLVADLNRRKLILKTRRFDPVQIELLKIAKSMESELCFKVPEIIASGNGYLLLENIEGENLNHYLNNDLPARNASHNDAGGNQYFEVNKNIADDYQKIIEKSKVEKSIKSKVEEEGGLLQSGEKWLFEKLGEWSQPIVDVGLIEKLWFDDLRQLFTEMIKQKGEDFFGWAHGNIIGDHIIVNKKGEYLLDLEFLPRPGKKYYDFLRALDWMFLKSDKLSFDDTVGFMKKYLPEFDWEEIKLVFAFRCIGILGCDIIKNGDKGAGNFEHKKADLIRFIRMDYN